MTSKPRWPHAGPGAPGLLALGATPTFAVLMSWLPSVASKPKRPHRPAHVVHRRVNHRDQATISRLAGGKAGSVATTSTSAGRAPSNWTGTGQRHRDRPGPSIREAGPRNE